MKIISIFASESLKFKKMKKLLIISLAVFCSVSIANAQYRPEGRSLSTEIYYTPTIGSLENSKTLSMPDYGIKVRMMLNDNVALRLNIGLTSKGDKETDIQTGADKVEYKYFRNSVTNNFLLAPGIEYHFTKFERVFPYIGAEIGFSAGNTVDKTWNTANEDYTLKKNPILGFNLGVMTGFDVYICKGLYTGLEFGLGYQSTKNGKEKSEISAGGTTTTEIGKTTSSKNNFGFYVVPSLKVGWHF